MNYIYRIDLHVVTDVIDLHCGEDCSTLVEAWNTCTQAGEMFYLLSRCDIWENELCKFARCVLEIAETVQQFNTIAAECNARTRRYLDGTATISDLQIMNSGLIYPDTVILCAVSAGCVAQRIHAKKKSFKRIMKAAWIAVAAAVQLAGEEKRMEQASIVRKYFSCPKLEGENP